ncbi:reverse transcriptase domain-containing protein [Tanacetum coccineum]
MFIPHYTRNARVWFDDLPPESIDSYNDLREAFLKNYLQQKKCIRDPIVLHDIKQRDEESTEDFIQRYKTESGNVKGAPECMRIFGFVHGITNPNYQKISLEIPHQQVIRKLMTLCLQDCTRHRATRVFIRRILFVKKSMVLVDTGHLAAYTVFYSDAQALAR